MRFEEGGGVLERGPPRRAPAPWRTGAGLAAGRATGGAESDRAPVAGRAAVNLWGALEVMSMGAGVLRRDAASFEVSIAAKPRAKAATAIRDLATKVESVAPDDADASASCTAASDALMAARTLAQHGQSHSSATCGQFC